MDLSVPMSEASSLSSALRVKFRASDISSRPLSRALEAFNSSSSPGRGDAASISLTAKPR
jgi:hypothetical protein